MQQQVQDETVIFFTRVWTVDSDWHLPLISHCISILFPRENQKVDYDQRLQQEVESLRARTALEMEQLKTQTREMFERENRYELARVSPGKLIWYKQSHLQERREERGERNEDVMYPCSQAFLRTICFWVAYIFTCCWAIKIGQREGLGTTWNVHSIRVYNITIATGDKIREW